MGERAARPALSRLRPVPRRGEGVQVVCDRMATRLGGPMSKKHNTKHNRSRSNYKVRLEAGAPGRLTDPILSDGKRASAKRS